VRRIFPAGKKAKRDQYGRRILLDGNTDGGAAVMLPPIMLQREGVWISSGLFYIYLQATGGHM